MNPKGAIKNYFNHNNEYVKTHHADFAPLWQLTGITGGIVGGLKGALDQDPYGQQIDPGNRLMKVATGGLTGAGLGAAVGGGLPQLLKEAPEAKVLANSVNEATGINVDPEQIPISLKERIAQRRSARKPLRSIPQNRYIQNAKDVVSQGVEDINQYVINPLSQAPNRLRDMYEQASLSPMELQIRQQTRQAIQDEAANLTNQAVRQGILNSPTATNAAQQAREVANEAIRQQTLSPGDRIGGGVIGSTIGGTVGAVAGTPLGPLGTVAGAHLGGVAGAKIGANEGTQRVVENVKGLGQKAMKIDRSGKDWLNKRFGTSFSKQLHPVNFGIIDSNKPYLTGASIGALGGTVAGGIYGLNQGMNQGVESDQNQLSQIQAIPDPYARKQQWDIYDSDLSRAGRSIANTGNTIGQTALGAGAGAVGLGLLGGAGLTAYTNIKNKKFTPLGQPQVGRGEALKILLTGRR